MRIAADADKLLSFAVRIGFNATKLEVIRASVGSDRPAGLGARHEHDGLHVYGASLHPVNGKSVLAELVFRVLPSALASSSPISVGLAKDAPAAQDFAQFVDASGAVLDAELIFPTPSTVCIVKSSCPCECNGVVNYYDYAAFIASRGSNRHTAGILGPHRPCPNPSPPSHGRRERL